MQYEIKKINNRLNYFPLLGIRLGGGRQLASSEQFHHPISSAQTAKAEYSVAEKRKTNCQSWLPDHRNFSFWSFT